MAVFLEVLLRVVALIPLDGPGFVNDDAIGYRQKPGSQQGDITVNSRGFNDPEPPGAKPDGEQRVVFVGDSFTFGVLGHDKVFPQVTAALLNQAGRPVRAVSLGVGASGPQEYLRVLQNEAPPLAPDLVVVTVYLGNDIAQANLRYRTLLYAGQPAMMPDPFGLTPSVDGLYTLRVSRRALRAVRDRLGDPCQGGIDVATDPDLNQFLRRTYEFEADVFHRPPIGPAADGLADLDRLFGAYRDAAAAMRARLLVVLAPSQLQVTPRIRAKVLACTGQDEAAYDFAGMSPRVAAMLERRGIEHLDLTPVFAAATSAEPLYHTLDTHWNEAGNRLAAEAIARKLIAVP
jgi:lysophospholipase L1-like esterase